MASWSWCVESRSMKSCGAHNMSMRKPPSPPKASNCSTITEMCLSAILQRLKGYRPCAYTGLATKAQGASQSQPPPHLGSESQIVISLPTVCTVWSDLVYYLPQLEAAILVTLFYSSCSSLHHQMNASSSGVQYIHCSIVKSRKRRFLFHSRL